MTPGKLRRKLPELRQALAARFPHRGMCPGNDESAGKRRSGKTRQSVVAYRAA